VTRHRCRRFGRCTWKNIPDATPFAQFNFAHLSLKFARFGDPGGGGVRVLKKEPERGVQN
jgi:hypothetical protein